MTPSIKHSPWPMPLILISLLLVGGVNAIADLKVTRLRCEYLENPLGIDAPHPRLSWILESSQRAQHQTAYQILVASRPEWLEEGRADLWDSGRVRSSQSIQVDYAGRPLVSSQQCHWTVRVWDNDGKPSPWSRPARWEMGLLKPADWQAQWIARTTDTNVSPAPLLRRTFDVNGKLARARAYVCGLGYYELYVNGRKADDALLNPGFTRYDRRALYVTHDLTPLLRDGANALGVILGNGWFNCHTRAVWNFHEAPWRQSPRLLLQLHLEYTDGRQAVLVSDGTWKCAAGPIVFDSIYGGETYDARLEQPGWAGPAFEDSSWQRVQVVPGPGGLLAAQMMPPIRLDRQFKPARITEPKPGVFIVDAGQNLAGMAELRVRGPAGARVQMRYGERLHPDGTLDTRDIEQHVKKLGAAQQHQTDTYILNGRGAERWRSRFTYHGFQYIEVTGFPGRPTLDNFSICFVHSDVPEAGRFECSDPLINRIQRAAQWAFLSNLQGIPTDCPHREKNGWTGDAHLAAEQANFNFMPVTVHAKWIIDLGDEQKPGGQLPGIVPTSGWGYSWGNGPAWDSAFLLIPHYAYIYYGDTAMLRRHYDGMKRYVDYLTTRAKDGIVGIGLNDWAPWKTKTEAPITDTAYYYVDTRILAHAARLLGKPSDAAHYEALAASIKEAFNRRFFKPETAQYDNGSQTALSCALYQGLVEPAHKDRVLANLVASVEKANNQIDTGILGAKYLLNALLENGRADVAWRMIARKDQPGWGWWIEQGATTLWEQWSGAESRNHIMFGDVSAWFYKAIAGIVPDPSAPGFKHFFIKPHLLGDLTWARGEYHSIHGPIVSAWKVADGRLHLDLTVPPNTTTTVLLPLAGPALENGRPVVQAKGVKLAGNEGGRVRLEVGSGHYRFSGSLGR